MFGFCKCGASLETTHSCPQTVVLGPMPVVVSPLMDPRDVELLRRHTRNLQLHEEVVAIHKRVEAGCEELDSAGYRDLADRIRATLRGGT